MKKKKHKKMGTAKNIFSEALKIFIEEVRKAPKNKKPIDILKEAGKKAMPVFLEALPYMTLESINPELSKADLKKLKTCPKTMKDAVNILFKEIKERNKKTEINYIKHFKTGDAFATSQHHSSGMGIRNDFGMWIPNLKLLRDCGSLHPDDASSKIHIRLWERVKKEL